MRFVVVEIPDDQEALDFIKAVTNGEVFYGVPGDPDLVDGREVPTVKWRNILEGWKVPQVYAVPTKFCECTTTHKEGKSKKYGWWVCTNCAKPRKGSMQHPFNLAEASVPAVERKYYMGFRADRRGWRIPNKLP